jgi:hypothetical protein
MTICSESVGSEVITAVTMKDPVFWVVTPCRSESKKPEYAGGMLVSSVFYSSSLKMEEICSSETPDSLRATWCYNSEGCALSF